MNKSGRDVHGEVEHAREGGDFLKALQLSDEAFLLYQQENNVFGMGDILASRSITLRLLFEKNNDNSFLILAKHESMAGVEIAKKSTNKSDLIMPLFRLGQVQEELNELADACKSYKEAIECFESNPPKEHNRPAVLCDMKIRYFVCEYKNGNSEALQKAEEALSQLEGDQEEVEYTKDVWSSGGHMKIAEALRGDNPAKAKEHLQKAKGIIDGNPDLKIRKSQWEKLTKQFD